MHSIFMGSSKWSNRSVQTYKIHILIIHTLKTEISCHSCTVLYKISGFYGVTQSASVFIIIIYQSIYILLLISDPWSLKLFFSFLTKYLFRKSNKSVPMCFWCYNLSRSYMDRIYTLLRSLSYRSNYNTLFYS